MPRSGRNHPPRVRRDRRRRATRALPRAAQGRRRRRRRARVVVDVQNADAAFGLLSDSGLDVQPTAPLLPRAMDLARRLTHPVYDCVYLTLAERAQAPLVTADQRLVRRLSARRTSRSPLCAACRTAHSIEAQVLRRRALIRARLRPSTRPRPARSDRANRSAPAPCALPAWETA